LSARHPDRDCFGDGRLTRPDERFVLKAIIACVAAGPSLWL
jgi:hypothetical protein